MKRGKAARKGRRGRRAAHGGADRGAFDVAALREALGRPHGNKAASRSMLAELIGASEGSVLNWEKGKPPTEKYAARLRQLAEQASKGTVALPHRNRGGRRPRHAGASAAAPARAAALGRRRGPGRPPSVAPIAGAAALLYANQITVDMGTNDARIRFAVRLPGEAAARAVADVMIPRHALDNLRV